MTQRRHSNPHYRLRTLDGNTRLISVEPHGWNNSVPLVPPGDVGCRVPRLADLPLEAFPTIDDFRLEVAELVPSDMGFHIAFYSDHHGRLASFPWWDHVEADLARDDFVVPLGPASKPFHDLDQGWEIIIFEHGDYVYVLEGDSDRGSGVGFHTWFRVWKNRYLEEWRRAVDQCRAVVSKGRRHR